MLDEKMKTLIREDETLKEQQQLLKSIPGIGEITSVYLLMVTKGFTAFTSGRKFACFSGVAPFLLNTVPGQVSKERQG